MALRVTIEVEVRDDGTAMLSTEGLPGDWLRRTARIGPLGDALSTLDTTARVERGTESLRVWLEQAQRHVEEAARR